MNFIEAVKLLKYENKISRIGWLEIYSDVNKKSIYLNKLLEIEYQEDMRIAGLKGYVLKLEDFLADDWEVLEEKP